RVEAGVGRDAVEPGPWRAAALEPAQPAPGPQERFLQRVLGVLDGAEHAVAVGVQLAAQRLHQPPVGGLVARLGGPDQRALPGGPPPRGLAGRGRAPARTARASRRTAVALSGPPGSSTTKSAGARLGAVLPAVAIPGGEAEPDRPGRQLRCYPISRRA